MSSLTERDLSTLLYFPRENKKSPQVAPQLRANAAVKTTEVETVKKAHISKLISLLLLFLAGTALGQNEKQKYTAKNNSFSIMAPSAFQVIQPIPKEAILAIEVSSFGVSLLVNTSEPVEIETKKFASKMKENLTKGGAQILGTVVGQLHGKPAVSFLVGGVKPGKESLFAFNLREDAVYGFILNYPVGSRQDAAELWDDISPTLVFTPPPKKKKKKG